MKDEDVWVLWRKDFTKHYQLLRDWHEIDRGSLARVRAERAMQNAILESVRFSIRRDGNPPWEEERMEELV
jgi:hypothetical protein